MLTSYIVHRASRAYPTSEHLYMFYSLDQIKLYMYTIR